MAVLGLLHPTASRVRTWHASKLWCWLSQVISPGPQVCPENFAQAASSTGSKLLSLTQVLGAFLVEYQAYRATDSAASSIGRILVAKALLVARSLPDPTENSVSQSWRPYFVCRAAALASTLSASPL